jgi:hypothetical protein
MKLEISVDELKKRKIFVATPMYGGMSHGMFVKSCLDLQTLCHKYGIDVRFSFIFNESLITRARNYLVDEFLRAEEYTHLLFIDSDVCFDAKDVITMLAIDKEIIGGPYPKKTIKWSSVIQAVKNNPEITPNELEKVTGDYVFNTVSGTGQFQISEPLEVLEIGTGFMMVKREVFDKFKEAYPEFEYKPDHANQANFDGSRMIHAYFDTVIDRGKSERYLSEDYMFCQWWRNIGGKIWLCPWMRTQHVGTYSFIGDMGSVAQHVGII